MVRPRVVVLQSLVGRGECLKALERLDMEYRAEGAVRPVYILVEPATHFELCLQITSPIDPSGAAEIKSIVFQCGSIDDRLVVTTLVSTSSQLTSRPTWEISPPTAVLSLGGWLKK